MNPSAVTTGTGPAGACPCWTCGHLARTQTAGGVVRDENSLVFSLQRQSLLFLAHRGLSHVPDKAGGDDPGEAERAGLTSFLTWFSSTPPPPLVRGPVLGDLWGPPPSKHFHGLILYGPLF